MDSWRFLKRKTQKSTESIYLLCYSLLMFSERLPQVMDDLRFALQVLREDSCLGLDPEYALKLQSVILRQIERDQHALNRRKPVETSTETVAA